VGGSFRPVADVAMQACVFTLEFTQCRMGRKSRSDANIRCFFDLRPAADPATRPTHDCGMVAGNADTGLFWGYLPKKIGLVLYTVTAGPRQTTDHLSARSK
jgi:hypothetical protein